MAAETGLSPTELRRRLQAAAGEGGSGTENPSCLRNARRRPAYLFDVALAARGYLMQPSEAPPYVPALSTPPPEGLVAAVPTGRWLDETLFVEETTPLRRWTNANECALFVRVWDQTLPAEKQLYKDRMRTLESVFYKFEVSSSPSPADQPTPPNG